MFQMAMENTASNNSNRSFLVVRSDGETFEWRRENLTREKSKRRRRRT